ncbi:hydrogenase, Fe-only [Desulfofarcimen acetoxidans DSM 771]|uniref:Hydrogenase, Fe-only n=1 Tax=Desulfofarcimen acetoxidans (strain ATCC 49208 / DSM 771 / KCTC 5769 / VKM B-1644 / 5575) TaxID=485916 RepID=C8VXD7_DESAS|nr:NADH-dependent [FeFe] hydrogenase, group A6 [Desulfofarcimen acetoxidans]ACV64533.1 hydrogenase, Fe-only [Desulfofarcimen acetoxidans DSM 771]
MPQVQEYTPGPVIEGAGHLFEKDEKNLEKVRLFIDGKEVTALKGISVLEAARSVGITIPSLCYLKGINEIGSCRVCMVEVEVNGVMTLQASCVYPVAEGIRVYTNTPQARRVRRTMVELLLSDHHRECTACIRNLNCELQNLADDLGIRNIKYTGETNYVPIFANNPFIMRDYNKCIKCRRCEAICSKVQEVNVYSALGRGFEVKIAPAFIQDLSAVACITCGQCVIACPTGSLVEKECIEEVWDALADKDKYVVVQTAPSIQVTLGESFGLPVGTIVTGKLVSALRRMGFDKVFATDFTADLTIMEEAHELLDRLNGHGRLPLLSSCSPGWVKFCEHFYPEFTENMSTCKSPHEMFGALTKTYFAEKEGLDPEKIVVVAIMPCTAKKYEASRPEFGNKRFKDVDWVLTTRELSRMIRQMGINFTELPDEDYDQPMGMSTGAGAIFGATGGVIEAAVRTAYYLSTGEEMDLLDYSEFEGISGLKIAEVKLKDRTIKVAIAHGTGNARRLLDRLKAGEEFHYAEIMACPGGCVGGGGQPIFGGREHKEISLDYRHNRADALHRIDLSKELRRSHENPAVKKIYEEYLGRPLGEKSRELLHTCFTPRGKMPGFAWQDLPPVDHKCLH